LYSSYFGGSSQDTITAQTRDSAGNVYVAGTTTSADFPTTAGVYEASYPGPPGYNAAFVAKFSPAGALVWSTFLGPGTYQFSVVSGLQVDAAQNVYVAGIFQDPGFPTTARLPNSGSVFLTKLNASGSHVIYSALLGGHSTLANPQLVLDSAANAFVAGTGDICCDGNTGLIGPLGGVDDFWIAEINSAGTALSWSVEIGGTGSDEADGLAIDRENKLYVAGYSDSLDFPTTNGALNQRGIGRTLVVKLDPSQLAASSMVYSALIGNPGRSSNDFISAQSIAVDSSGHAYVGAWTYNTGLFTSKWAFQREASGTANAYVFELNANGSAFLNGTYLGGAGDDFVGHVAVDSAGNTNVVGSSNSSDFPTTAYGNLASANSLFEGYYVKLNPQFAAISSVQFGSARDGAQAFGSTRDGTGGLWVTGYAGRDFPVTPNAYQRLYNGNYDGFLLHTNFPDLCGTGGEGVELCNIDWDTGSPGLVHITAQAVDVEKAVSIVLSIDGAQVYSLHAAQLDTWVPVALGSHCASVVVTDSNGAQYRDERSFMAVQVKFPNYEVPPAELKMGLAQLFSPASSGKPSQPLYTLSDLEPPRAPGHIAVWPHPCSEYPQNCNPLGTSCKMEPGIGGG
jgi:hypothetical protein